MKKILNDCNVNCMKISSTKDICDSYRKANLISCLIMVQVQFIRICLIWCFFMFGGVLHGFHHKGFDTTLVLLIPKHGLLFYLN